LVEAPAAALEVVGKAVKREAVVATKVVAAGAAIMVKATVAVARALEASVVATTAEEQPILTDA